MTTEKRPRFFFHNYCDRLPIRRMTESETEVARECFKEKKELARCKHTNCFTYLLAPTVGGSVVSVTLKWCTDCGALQVWNRETGEYNWMYPGVSK